MLSFEDNYSHPLLNHQKSTRIRGFRNFLLFFGCVLFAGAAVFKISERNQIEEKLGQNDPPPYMPPPLPAPRLAVATQNTASGSQSYPVYEGAPVVPGRDDGLRSVEVSPELARIPPPYSSFGPSIPYGKYDLAAVPATKNVPRVVKGKARKQPPAGLPPDEPVTIKVDYTDPELQRQEALRRQQQKTAVTGGAFPKSNRNPLDIPGLRSAPAFDPLPYVGLSPGNNIPAPIDRDAPF